MPSLHALQKRQQRDAHYERRRASLVSNSEVQVQVPIQIPEFVFLPNVASPHRANRVIRAQASGVRGRLSSMVRKMGVQHGKEVGPYEMYIGAGMVYRTPARGL